MRTAIALLNVALIGAGTCLLAGTVERAQAEPTPVFQDDQGQTEDVLYLTDGRVLRGQIISEDRNGIVFEYIDRRLNMTTKLTIRQHEIEKIERDVAVKDEGLDSPADRKKKTTMRRDEANDALEIESRFGKIRSRAATTGTDVPTVYLVPMTGQMGTDIGPELYKQVVEDIRMHDPDLVVIMLDSKQYDVSLGMVVGDIPIDRSERSIVQLLDEYVELVNIFQDDLRDYRQVLWVKDSQGISSLVAMSWPTMYMTPNARLTGLSEAVLHAYGWSDPDVRAKMIAAFSGYVQGMLLHGDHADELAKAMTRPEVVLSASWKGRDVDWSLDTKGEYVVDSSDKRALNLAAKTAEDLRISDGTADSLDDVLLLEGLYEFEIIDGSAIQIVDGYVEDWRRLYDETKKWMREYEKNRSRAAGDEAISYMGRARKNIQKVISAMNRYKAIELRWQMDGIQKLALITLDEQLAEQIRAMRNAGRGTGGGGGGGSDFGGGRPR